VNLKYRLQDFRDLQVQHVLDRLRCLFLEKHRVKMSAPWCVDCGKIPVRTYNDDKPHRCPRCHTVAIPEIGPYKSTVHMLTFQAVTCCNCGTQFTRWPRLVLRRLGVVCDQHEVAK